MDVESEELPVVSPGLLPSQSWKEDYQFNPQFDLGIGEWMGEGDNVISSDHGTLAAEENNSGVENKENTNAGVSVEESRKSKCLSLKRTVKKQALKEASERFGVTATENEINKAMKGVVPINTETSTKWAVKILLNGRITEKV